MEFNQKLQELRKMRGLTQEELAEDLYVSRTAISKWESGRGYPNIESLKAIAKFFAVTLDELISSDEALTLAEEDNRGKGKHFCDLIYGLLDLCIAMLLFLPFFARSENEVIQSVSLIFLDGIQPYIKAAYLAVVISMSLMGVLLLALQSCTASVWSRYKTKASLLLSVVSVLLFILSRQPYAAAFVFILLIVKTFVLIKQK